MLLERLVKMNGINYNTLLSNTGLFSNRSANTDTVKAKTASGAQSKKTTDSRQANADRDTYEHSEVREANAGYERPKRVESQENKYKALDSNGVQEGIELSDAAKKLLDELREKYGNMDIAVAEWSTDEEQDYYAGLTDKDFSVLINPELLERMAADESVREQYETVLSNAGKASDTLKEELGEDAERIKSFTITVDADGNVSYAVQLLKDMADKAKNDSKTSASDKQQERIEKKRAERKEQEKQRLEKLETEKIEADSIEGLIAAIKEKLYPSEETGKITIKDEAAADNSAEITADANVAAE